MTPFVRPSRGLRLAEMLAAILAGNILYLLVEPHLPNLLRHRLFRVDLGLAVDFLFCVILYGLIRLFLHRKAKFLSRQ